MPEKIKKKRTREGPFFRLSKTCIAKKRVFLPFHQSAKSRDLCVAFCTSQGASVRQRRACSPLQELEQVAGGYLFDMLKGPERVLFFRLSKTYIAKKRVFPTFHQSAKSRDLCVAFCTSQGASVRQRRACRPLQELEQVAGGHLLDMLKGPERVFFSVRKDGKDQGERVW